MAMQTPICFLESGERCGSVAKMLFENVPKVGELVFTIGGTFLVWGTRKLPACDPFAMTLGEPVETLLLMRFDGPPIVPQGFAAGVKKLKRENDRLMRQARQAKRRAA